MKLLFVFLSFVFCTQVAHARAQLGVRAQSFGGAIRAEASSNDAIFYNPAGIIKKRRLSPDIDYLLDSGANTHRIGASIVDSSTSSWGLGLAYSGCFLQKSDRPSSHLVYLASAMPIATDMFSLGLSMHYTYDRRFGADSYAHFFNIDAGLLVNIPMGLSMAVVADNLLKAKGHEKNLGLGLGLAYDLGAILPLVPLSLSFDWVMDNVKSSEDLGHKLGSGIQYIIVGLVPMRLGYFADLGAHKNLLSLGTGIIAGGISFDALYQQDLSVGKSRHFGLALRWAI